MPPELYSLAGLFFAVVVTAVLVNGWAPTERGRVRRVVVLFGLFVVSLGVSKALEAAGAPRWALRFQLAAEFTQAFTIVNAVGTVMFAVALPMLGLAMPMIASDVLVGVGYAFATMGILAGHGFDARSMLATSAVVSAVLAISLQSTLGNILGGIALQLDGSVHEGDWIQLENGRQGRVRAIRWRHTVVETRDWSTVIVPNAHLLSSNITLLGKRNGRVVPQRMWVWFNVDFRFAPSRVVQVVTDAICGSPIEGVASEPTPSVVCMDFTKEQRESVATYAVRYWLTDLAADDPTSSRVRARIYTALQRAEIPLAVPAQTTFLEVRNDVSRARHTKRRVQERLEALRTVTLFRHLTEPELTQLAAGMSRVVFAAGELITRQGAVAHWLYVLTRGTAEVQVTPEKDTKKASPPVPPKTIASLHAPDFFGEMGLMTGVPRNADVVATSDVDCYRLGKATFEEVLLARPAMVEELSEKLATRRMELLAARDGLVPGEPAARHATERDRIVEGIKTFFGL